MPIKKLQIKSERGINLSSVFYKNQTDKAIILCHGFTSNKDRERHIKVSEELYQKGYSVIRFDFGGCGESEDASITIAGQVTDLQSVINFLKDQGVSKFSFLAESFGALVALKSELKNLSTMVLWAPVTDNKSGSTLRKILQEKKETNTGLVVYHKDGRDHFLPKEYFQERANINQENLFYHLECPILIIHGNNDTTVLLDSSKRAIQFTPKNSELKIIGGANHKFEGHEDELIELTVDWFMQHF